MSTGETERFYTERAIVVVIFIVLAAFVVPRILEQPERVIVTEAINYLGAIRRAQEVVVGSTQGGWIKASCVAGGVGDAGWRAMGMGPLPASSRFNYFCVSGPYGSGSDTSAAFTAGTCTAARVTFPGEPRSSKMFGTITMRLNTGTITQCGGGYEMRGAPGAQGTICG